MFLRLPVPELARCFRVLAVDLPGHRKPPLDHDAPLFVETVLTAINAEKIKLAGAMLFQQQTT